MATGTVGGALTEQSNELVQCIEELRTKREEIDNQITEEEDEKAKVQSDLQVLSKRLTTLNESIARKLAARNDYDREPRVLLAVGSAAAAQR